MSAPLLKEPVFATLGCRLNAWETARAGEERRAMRAH